MLDALPVLVVAATARELAADLPCATLLCGVGPVEAAARTAAAIAQHRPKAVLHVGIAGARRSAGIAASTLVIGSAARYSDLVLVSDLAPRELRADAALLAAAQRALPTALVMPIATSARVGGGVGGGVGCDVEAMEGFAVLRAAQLAGVPALELRAISNEVEETDRARWHFDAAFAAITAVTPCVLEEIAACVR
jgi:nucleoside phosphorylase